MRTYREKLQECPANELELLFLGVSNLRKRGWLKAMREESGMDMIRWGELIGASHTTVSANEKYSTKSVSDRYVRLCIEGYRKNQNCK